MGVVAGMIEFCFYLAVRRCQVPNSLVVADQSLSRRSFIYLGL